MPETVLPRSPSSCSADLNKILEPFSDSVYSEKFQTGLQNLLFPDTIWVNGASTMDVRRNRRTVCKETSKSFGLGTGPVKEGTEKRLKQKKSS